MGSRVTSLVGGIPKSCHTFGRPFNRVGLLSCIIDFALCLVDLVEVARRCTDSHSR